MGMMQRRKGAAAEREFCALWHRLTGERLNRRLGQERDGGSDVHSELGNLAIQIKNQARLAIPAWTKQAEADCPEGMRPALAYRLRGGRWYVSMEIEDLAYLLRENVPSAALQADLEAYEEGNDVIARIKAMAIMRD